MSSSHFVMLSQWRLQCAPQQAWSLIENVDQWADWWSDIRGARLVRRGDADGANAMADVSWKTPLGHDIRLQITTAHVDAPRLIEGFATGDVEGHALWSLEPDVSGGLLITHRWDIQLSRGWMRRLAPILRPIFAWSHFQVMRRGARGMARHLGCEMDRWEASSTTPDLQAIARSG